MPKPSGIDFLRSFLIRVAWNLPSEDDDIRWMVSEILSHVQLPDQEREVLNLSFGLDGSVAFSYAEIAQKFQTTANAIRDIENRAIALVKSQRKRGK